MKHIAFLLSIYIFTLNLAPCADFIVSDNDAQTEITQIAHDDHQHQESDSCSPFCICQCCHINATHLKFVSVQINTSLISTQDFFYLNGTEKDFTTSILQPPRA